MNEPRATAFDGADLREANLAMMIRRLCSRRIDGTFAITDKKRDEAMELLRSMGLEGSPLRSTPSATTPSALSAAVVVPGWQDDDAQQALTLLARFIHLSATPDKEQWALCAHQAIGLLNKPAAPQPLVPPPAPSPAAPTVEAVAVERGFLWDEVDRSHTPTLLVRFQPGDWESRDRLAAALSSSDGAGT